MQNVYDSLCVLYLNDQKIYVLPIFDPFEKNPVIKELAVFLSVDESNNAIFEKSPSWLIDMVNETQLYNNIMDQYEENSIT